MLFWNRSSHSLVISLNQQLLEKQNQKVLHCVTGP